MEDYLQLICAVLAVLVLLVMMYVGSVFVMRERSFESAIAEQKRQVPGEESASPGKPERKARRQQVRSKRTDKSPTKTAKAAAAVNTDVVDALPAARHHSPGIGKVKRVELELEPEIIAIDDSDTKSTGSKGSQPVSPSKPAKSILLNKGEKSEVVATISVPETFHIRQISVDELELKLERRRSDTAEHTTAQHIELVTVAPVAAAPEVNTKAKKKKAKAVTNSPHTSVEPITELEPVVQSSITSTLSSSPAVVETHFAEGADKADISVKSTTVLLQSTSKAAESKPADSKLAAELKKLKEQLDEKEKAFVKEHSQVMQLNKQVHQLRQELAAETSKGAEHQLQSNLAVAELRKAAMQSNDQHVREGTALRAQIEALHTQLVEFTRVNQELTNENKMLKDAAQRQHDMAHKMKILEDALAKSGATMASSENVKRHLEATVRQHQEQIDKLSSRLKELDAEKLALAERLLAVEAVKQSTADSGLLQTVNIQRLENSLKDVEVQNSALEELVSSLKFQLLVAEQKLSQKNLETVQVSAVQQNGVLSDTLDFSSQTDAVSVTVATDATRDEVDTCNLTPRTNDTGKLEALLAAQKLKNEELRQKNYAALEALSRMEKLAESSVGLRDDVTRKEAELKNLRTELKELRAAQKNMSKNEAVNKPRHVQPVVAVSTSSTGEEIVNLQHELMTKCDELARIEQSMADQKRRNNDLRQKNYAAMEALGKMEKMAEGAARLRDEIDRKDSEVKAMRAELKEFACKRQNGHAESADKQKLTTAVQRQTEEIELLQSQLGEKEAQLEKLEAELRSIKSASTSVPDLFQDGSQDGRQDGCQSAGGGKQVTFFTRIQETSSWDLSQLVLDLDTKTAELNILQSLLDRNENALHSLQAEQARTTELVKRLQSEVQEKNSAIEKLIAEKTVNGNSPAAAGDEDERIKTKQNLATLESTVQHYKNLLRDTEAMLSNLEASVEKEEITWRAKLTATEQQLEKEREEMRLLKQQISVSQHH